MQVASMHFKERAHVLMHETLARLAGEACFASVQTRFLSAPLDYAPTARL